MIVDLDRAVQRLEPSGKWSDPAPLSTYRYAPAYVLLGDPGAGKTTAFERETRATVDAQIVTARDFRTIGAASVPEGCSTLFVDGLDELRAGSGDPRRPFDDIRARLARLGLQRVRLACRELDWLGRNDQTNLANVVPGREVVVLRLEPLKREDQRRVVSVLRTTPEPSEFLAQAADRNLVGLLGNPQTLVLLARVVAENGDFPEGRIDTFEQACRLLAHESNEEHRLPAPVPEPGMLLRTAGQMCAVNLLSGAAGFSLLGELRAEGFIPVSIFDNAAPKAVRTRLFTGAGAGRGAPVHANLASFLAARHLAELVDGTVPRGRVLALLSGPDGLPPTPLRALVAWLAALSPALRPALIQRDPVAVLLYGDVREFRPDEKALLLEQIARAPSQLHEYRWPDSALAGLATADMDCTLRTALRNPDRTDAEERVVAVVVKALDGSPAGKRLADCLEEVVRDETRSPAARDLALDAWIAAFQEAPDRMHRYRELLASVRDAPAGDPQGAMTATLLDALYPDGLSPAELWDFFPSHAVFPQGLLAELWQRISRDCPEEHLTRHLDRLAELIPNLRPVLRERLLHVVPLRLLARALKTRRDGLNGSRLFRWLSVGLDETCHLTDRGSEAKDLIAGVRGWLEHHPDLQKEVIRVALRSDEFRPRGTIASAIRELLYRSQLPEDIGKWHLGQVARTASMDHRLTEFHILEFLTCLARQPVCVDEELASARRRLATNSAALRRLESGLRSELPDGYLEDAVRDRRARAPQVHLLRVVRESRARLLANDANPALLHELARLYHAGAFVEGETTDREQLLDALDGDEELTEAAIAGIRSAPNRGDIPSVKTVLRLRSRHELDWLTLPVLVGLTDRSVGDVLGFDDERLGTMLALRLARQDSSEDAPWYRECLRGRSSLVAGILLSFGRAVLPAGERHLPDLYHLSRKPAYGPVARKVTLPLLLAFPARARVDQHDLLADLLHSALVHCDRETLRELVERKTALGSMTRAQRGYWLAAGLAWDPTRFGPLLSEATDAHSRCQILQRMFPVPEVSIHEVPGLLEALDPAAIKFLIRELGAQQNPLRFATGVSSGWGWGDALAVEDLIGRLGTIPDKSATNALEQLAEEPPLSRWGRHLQRALETQRTIRRDTEHTAPTPAEVIAALCDGPPASAADLREIVLDRLDRIGEELRTTNAELWRPFWNEQPERIPKHEDACRDALLATLRHRLPDGCDAQPEGQYAGDRRADIRVAAGKWNVPVEIKKNSHRDVWRAVRNQLLPRYTNDPATKGLGIYLVLWFGARYTAPVAEGPRPKSPAELRDRLLSVLSPEERRRAAILVVDVTPP